LRGRIHLKVIFAPQEAAVKKNIWQIKNPDWSAGLVLDGLVYRFATNLKNMSTALEASAP